MGHNNYIKISGDFINTNKIFPAGQIKIEINNIFNPSFPGTQQISFNTIENNNIKE